MDCHFPALGLLPPSVHEAQNMKSCHIDLIGINPPEEVTPLESLIRGENSKGISLWKQDSYGVGGELAGKRKSRGWSLGMEKSIFFNQGLGQVVEKVLCWDGGAGNELFPQLEELPWFYGNVR